MPRRYKKKCVISRNISTIAVRAAYNQIPIRSLRVERRHKGNKLRRFCEANDSIGEEDRSIGAVRRLEIACPFSPRARHRNIIFSRERAALSGRGDERRAVVSSPLSSNHLCTLLCPCDNNGSAHLAHRPRRAQEIVRTIHAGDLREYIQVSSVVRDAAMRRAANSLRELVTNL